MQIISGIILYLCSWTWFWFYCLVDCLHFIPSIVNRNKKIVYWFVAVEWVSLRYFDFMACGFKSVEFYYLKYLFYFFQHLCFALFSLPSIFLFYFSPPFICPSWLFYSSFFATYFRKYHLWNKKFSKKKKIEIVAFIKSL